MRRGIAPSPGPVRPARLVTALPAADPMLGDWYDPRTWFDPKTKWVDPRNSHAARLKRWHDERVRKAAREQARRSPGPSSVREFSGGLYNARATMRRGVCGPLVRAWQEFLRYSPTVVAAHGRLRVTGEFDAATDAATKTYQRVLGVGADGIVGPATYAAMRRKVVQSGARVTSTAAFGLGRCAGSGRAQDGPPDWGPGPDPVSEPAGGYGGGTGSGGAGSGDGAGGGQGPGFFSSLGLDFDPKIIALGLAGGAAALLLTKK